MNLSKVAGYSSYPLNSENWDNFKKFLTPPPDEVPLNKLRSSRLGGDKMEVVKVYMLVRELQNITITKC